MTEPWIPTCADVAVVTRRMIELRLRVVEEYSIDGKENMILMTDEEIVIFGYGTAISMSLASWRGNQRIKNNTLLGWFRADIL